MSSDMTLTCQEANCGAEFIFNERDQAFFKEMGFQNPKYCREHREARKIARNAKKIREAGGGDMVGGHEDREFNS